MEQKKIKGSKSSYYKKSENKEIETISKTINLGVNSAFNVGDVAIILTETEYAKLNELANTDATKEIAKLNETISDLNKQITNLTNKNTSLETINKSLSDANTELETKVSELNNRIRQTEKELSKYNAVNVDDLQQKTETLFSENIELNKEIKTKTDYIVYLEQLQTDFNKLIDYYRNKNILTPLLNAIGLSDIDKPQLKHLDMKGHQLNNNNTPAIETNSNSNVNSE